MFETINHIDQQLFLAINNGMQNSIFDWLCPHLRNPIILIPLYLVLIYFIIKKYKKKSVWILLGIALLLFISDWVFANHIKHLVERLRPCNEPIFQNQVRIIINCGSGFSFVSAHATNHFAIAVYMIGFFKSVRKWFLPIAILWASSIGFSQVYVGLHYPFDVICGAMLGSSIGFFCMNFIKTISKIEEKKVDKLST